VLDYESASATLGKPGNADLQLGLATAPALYAWEEYPEMGELIGRKFESQGDVDKVSDAFSSPLLASPRSISIYLSLCFASTILFPFLFHTHTCILTIITQARNLVHKSSAIARTKQLAQAYADEAKSVLQELPHSDARDALEVFAERVVGRKH
jgi:hexaprenyl-diphosphate synthase